MVRAQVVCPTCEQVLAGSTVRHDDRFDNEPPELMYKYDALPHKRDNIRLLKLIPSNPDNPHVECKLMVVPSEIKKLLKSTNGRSYEALSWCWGTAPPTSSIHVRKGGKMFWKKVQPDLLAALKALRDKHEDRYLWIDAICIDQQNVNEKNHQVEMMAMIYGQAQRVCIWLGDGDVSSSTAFRFIRNEVLQLQNFDELCDSPQASKKWGALLDLMQRKWFSRRWVVQEIALAHDAIIYCGKDTIPWKDFAVAVELFVEVETATHRLSEVMKKDPQFYHVPGWFEYVSELGASLLVEATGKLFRDTKLKESARLQGARKTTRSAPLLSLELLVSSLSIFEVTMPHDTIYALLAIARDTTPFASETESLSEETPATDGELPIQKLARTGTQLIKARTTSALDDFTRRKRYTVAYESPYVDACKTFIQFCVSQSDPTRALDIICRPWAAEDNKVNVQQNFFYENRPVPKEAIMRLPSWVPQLSGAPYAMYAHPGVHTLKMGRKNADPLVGLPDTHQRNYNAADTKGIAIQNLRFRKRVSHKMQHFSMYVKGFVLDAVEKVYPASQGGAVPEEWIEAVEWQDVEKSDPPDEFWRTLVGDRGLYGRNPPVYYARACKESFLKGGLQSGSVNTSDLINNERCSVVAQFCRRVQAVIWNRSLIKTSSGNIGLASKNVQKGDLACILYGCSVPVILRKCLDKKSPERLRQEREEDFLSTLVDIQRRWKARYKRYRRPRIQRALRVAIKFWSKSTKEKKAAAAGTKLPAAEVREEDVVVDHFLQLRYGRRWKNAVKIKRKARQEKWKEGPDHVLAEAMETPLPESGDISPTSPVPTDSQDTGGGSKNVEEQVAIEAKISQKEEEKAKVAKKWDEGYEAWVNEVPNSDEDSRYWYYEFLGEAYLHGMMDGEAISFQNANQIDAQRFELR